MLQFRHKREITFCDKIMVQGKCMQCEDAAILQNDGVLSLQLA